MKSIMKVIEAHMNQPGTSRYQSTIPAITACPKATVALVTT